MIQAPILFTAPGQEISTAGYPIDDSRATLVVSGPVINGQGHTTAVDGTCANCSGVILRNIQVSTFVALSIALSSSSCDALVYVILRSMEHVQELLQLQVGQILRWAVQIQTS